MTTKLVLYHFSSQEAAPKILATGFVGRVWLSPDVHSICGEQGRGVLLEVQIEAADVEAYEEMRTDETIDPETDEAIDDGQTETHVWYYVPAAVVNTRGKIRAVGDDERRTLWLEQ